MEVVKEYLLNFSEEVENIDSLVISKNYLNSLAILARAYANIDYRKLPLQVDNLNNLLDIIKYVISVLNKENEINLNYAKLISKDTLNFHELTKSREDKLSILKAGYSLDSAFIINCLNKKSEVSYLVDNQEYTTILEFLIYDREENKQLKRK